MYRTVVISSFGRLSALAAMVWTGSDLALWLPTVLVLPAQFQAFRGNGEHSIAFFRGNGEHSIAFFRDNGEHSIAAKTKGLL